MGQNRSGLVDTRSTVGEVKELGARARPSGSHPHGADHVTPVFFFLFILDLDQLVVVVLLLLLLLLLLHFLLLVLA